MVTAGLLGLNIVSLGRRIRDVTFTKPEVPPEKMMSQKLADEILKTGESTEELIALADTSPRPERVRTRSMTKALQTDQPAEQPAYDRYGTAWSICWRL